MGKLTQTNLQVSATSKWGCEASQVIAQVSAEYENLKGCPPRYDTPGTEIAKGARQCRDPGSENSQTALVRKLGAVMPVHVRAESDTR
jgi:hypothetical protein